MGGNPRRGRLQRLGLPGDGPGPDDWVSLASARVDAEQIVELLSAAGLEAQARPYGAADTAIAVLVRRRDHRRAEEILLRRPED